jgi:hypothetical protein
MAASHLETSPGRQPTGTTGNIATKTGQMAASHLETSPGRQPTGSTGDILDKTGKLAVSHLSTLPGSSSLSRSEPTKSQSQPQVQRDVSAWGSRSSKPVEGRVLKYELHDKAEHYRLDKDEDVEQEENRVDTASTNPTPNAAAGGQGEGETGTDTATTQVPINERGIRKTERRRRDHRERGIEKESDDDKDRHQPRRNREMRTGIQEPQPKRLRRAASLETTLKTPIEDAQSGPQREAEGPMFHAVRKGRVSAQSMTDERPYKDVEKTTEVPAASAVAANNDDGDAVGKSVAGDGGDGRHDSDVVNEEECFEVKSEEDEGVYARVLEELVAEATENEDEDDEVGDGVAEDLKKIIKTTSAVYSQSNSNQRTRFINNKMAKNKVQSF